MNTGYEITVQFGDDNQPDKPVGVLYLPGVSVGSIRLRHRVVTVMSHGRRSVQFFDVHEEGMAAAEGLAAALGVPLSIGEQNIKSKIQATRVPVEYSTDAVPIPKRHIELDE